MEVEKLMIQSALSNWNLTINRLNKFFGALSDEDFVEPLLLVTGSYTSSLTWLRSMIALRRFWVSQPVYIPN